MTTYTTKQLVEDHKKICEQARSIMEAKNHDYANPESKIEPMMVFRNFLACERLGICQTEQGMLVRLTDKISRISNLLKPGHVIAVEGEKLKDTVIDVINYIILIYSYVTEKEKHESLRNTDK